MKRLIILLFVLTSVLLAQENFFEKISEKSKLKNSITQKIKNFKTREGLKGYEKLKLKKDIKISKNYKGIFNIFDKRIDFNVVKDFGTDKNGITGYKADLTDGGYSIISSSAKGISASIWYKDTFYSIDQIEDNIYFISETDLNEEKGCGNTNSDINKSALSKIENIDYKITSRIPDTITVYVAYTPAVKSQYNDINGLVSNCKNITHYSYGLSNISTRIKIVGSSQVSYTESGNFETDVNRFMGKCPGSTGNGHLVKIKMLPYRHYYY